MVVYWDLLLGSTVIVNYSLLKTVAVAFRQKMAWWRTILGVLISVLSLLFFILPLSIAPLRYLMGIFIGLVAFPTRKWTIRILQISCFYLLNIAFIGGLVVFHVDNILFLIICLFYIILLFLIDKVNLSVIKEARLTYNATIWEVGSKLKAYYDTGNTSMYQGLPIIFLDERFHNDCFIARGKTKLEGLGGNFMMDIYQGNPLIINNKTYQVYYGFLKLSDYDVILNHHLEGLDD